MSSFTPDDLATHTDALRRIARSLLRSPDLADDAVQDTLALAWTRQPPARSRGAWLRGALRNVVRNQRRATDRRDVRHQTLTPRLATSPEAIREREQIRGVLLDAILSLDETHREVVLMRYDQELPPRAVAAALGIPVHAVHNRLRAGLEQLRRRLDKTHGGDTERWHRALVAFAPGIPSAVSASALIGSTLMFKKIVAVAALVLAGVGLWWGGTRWLAAPADTGTEVDEALLASDPDAKPGQPSPALVGSGTDVLATSKLRGAAEIFGLVVDGSGSPARGVPIAVWPQDEREYRSDGLMDAPAVGPVDPAVPRFENPTAVTVSDADGRFSVPGLPFGVRHYVEARPNDGHHAARTVIESGRTTLVVGQGVPLRLRVVDSEGNGKQAWVRGDLPFGTSNASTPTARWSTAWTGTDSEGRLVVPSVPNGRLVLSVVVPGWRSVHRRVVDVPADGEVLVQLGTENGAVLRGIVSDMAGNGIEDAEVVVSAIVTGLGPNGEMAMATTRTDAEGRYRIEHFKPGSIQSVDASAFGFQARKLVAHGFPLRGAADTTVHVTLVRSVSIAGVVVDSHGVGLAGVRVSAEPRMEPGSFEAHTFSTVPAITDAAGRFTLDAAPGWTAVHTEHAQYASQKPLRIDVDPAKSAAPIRITLRLGVKVTGRVVDESGHAIDRAIVFRQLGAHDGVLGWARASVSVGPDGRFTLSGLPKGHEWSVSAIGPDRSTAATTVQVDGDLDLGTLALRPTQHLRLSGRVVDPSGRPQAEIKVHCRQGTKSVGLLVTGVAGEFAFDTLTTGEYTLETVSSLQDQRSAPTAVTLVRDIDDLTLKRPATATLEGVVLDKQGEPARGIQIQLSLASSLRGSHMIYTYTDFTGRFAFEVMPGKEHVLRVMHKAVPGVYRAGQPNISLTYTGEDPTEYTVVEGTVTDPAGRPIEQFEAMVWHGTRRGSGGGARVASGRFYVRLQSAVTDVDITISRPRDAAGRRLNFKLRRVRDIKVGSGPIAIVLERGATMRGIVRMPSGDPLAECRVFVGSKAQFDRPARVQLGRDWIYTDATGRFEAVGLTDEETILQVRPPARFLEPKPLVFPSPVDDVVVRIDAGRYITGQVVDEAGVALPNVLAGVALRPESAREFRDAPAPSWVRSPWTTQTEADGSFRVGPVATGLALYLYATPAAPYLPVSQNVVGDGDPQVTLRASSGAFIEGTVRREDGSIPSETRVEVGASTVGATQRFRSIKSVMLKGAGPSAFRLGPLDPSMTYRLRAQEGRHREVFVNRVTAPATGVDVVLPMPLVVRGRIVGNDVAGFSISFTQGDRSTQTTVDASGQFKFALRTDAPGALRASRKGDPRHGLLQNVSPGTERHQVQLVDGQDIRGRILGLPEGRRAPIDVRARAADGSERVADVAPDGSFRIRGLRPGNVTLYVNHSEDGTVTGSREVAAGTDNVELRFVAR